MRRSGILLHISSLPSKYGIGTLGKEAFQFVDFLKAAGQSYWQVLPIGPTSFGNSPYQSPSTYAGNPYFIDFDLLAEKGILEKSDYESICWGENCELVDYATIYNERFKVLKKAFERGYERDYEKVENFKIENQGWLFEYALFMAIKEHFQGKAYRAWPRDIRKREKIALEKYKNLLQEKINFQIYVQYLFFKQWHALKAYANENGIEIVGDIPIYVAEDSVDTWSNPQLFMINEDRVPTLVAGCPPDAFTEDGQLWGNPVYNWEVIEKEDFKWWINRIKATSKIYDVVRIDHFRAFASFYAIKYGAANARVGQWIEGPGIKLFNKVKVELPKVSIIAEDLGCLTKEVYDLMDQVQYPGMKILLFAFGNDGNSEHIPYKIPKNSVAYIGTHDNDTFMGWLKKADKREVYLARRYMNITEEEGYNWGIIRTLYGTQADTAIVQMQDILGLDNEGRMNLPGTVGNNWCWRIKQEVLTQELSHKLYELTRIFGRLKSE